jgi:sodium/hydrogen antiporter
VLDERLPGNDTLMIVIVCTVTLSVVAHGVSANPLVKAFEKNVSAPTDVLPG